MCVNSACWPDNRCWVGDELIRDLRPQIGDTLTRQAGVSATSFSPRSVPDPVLRGMQGGRVAVLTDGLGTLDCVQHIGGPRRVHRPPDRRTD